MSTGPILGLASSYLQSILGTSSKSTAQASSTTQAESQSDNSQLSPFAQLMSTLQQLEQSNPTEYKQVTSQIATNLQSAASTASKDGNTAAATQLNQLATDFTSASQSGQLPSVQDLASALSGGGHHHHHGHHAASTAATDTSSTATSSTSSTDSNSALSQLLAAFQSNSLQNDTFNPMSIINNTLSSAGIPA